MTQVASLFKQYAKYEALDARTFIAELEKRNDAGKRNIFVDGFCRPTSVGGLDWRVIRKPLQWAKNIGPSFS
jgi:hypothetical protein